MSEEKQPEVNQEPTMKKLPVEESDLQERIAKFNEELGPLLGKYELGIGAQAGLSPQGTVVAQPMIVSIRKKVQEQPEPEVTKAPELTNPEV